MLKSNKGFTLIELMIVVAIIGILAAIAIPQYQAYSGKAQAAEGFVIVGSLRNPVIEAINTNGLSATTCALPVGHLINGKYVETTTFQVVGTTGCEITSKFKATGLSSYIAEKSIVQSFTLATGKWTCSSDLPANIVPSSC